MLTNKGTVKDAITGEPLPFANIYESDESGQYVSDSKGTITNEQGIYEFTATKSHITASYTGYDKQTKPVDRVVSFNLTTNNTLPEITVTARKPRPWLLYAAGAILIIATIIYFKKRK